MNSCTEWAKQASPKRYLQFKMYGVKYFQCCSHLWTSNGAHFHAYSCFSSLWPSLASHTLTQGGRVGYTYFQVVLMPDCWGDRSDCWLQMMSWKWFQTRVQCCYQMDTANRCAILYYPKLFDKLVGSSEQVNTCAQTSPCCVKAV